MKQFRARAFVSSRLLFLAGSWLLLVGLLAAGPGRAQESEPPADGGEVTAEPSAQAGTDAVVVEGERSRYHCSDQVYCPVTDLSSGDYWASKDTAEVLENPPGVEVQEGGGQEGPWHPMVRGADPASTAVYLDGILLNDPLGRPVDVSGVPLQLLGHVIVYRGRAPVEYPVSGTSGVVDLRTREPASETAYRATASAGSLRDYSGSVTVTGEAVGGSGMVGSSHQAGAGDYPYVDDRGTPGDAGDDREEVRRNNRYSDHDYLGRWDRKARGYRVYTGLYHGRRDRQEPGDASSDVEQARGGSELTVAYAGVKRPGLLSPDLDADVRVHYLTQSWWLYDDQGELGAPRHDENQRSRSGMDSRFDYYGLPGHQLHFYVGVFEDSYEPSSQIDGKVGQIRCARSSVYVNVADEMAFGDGRLRVRPGLRYGYEDNSYGGETLIAQAGLAKTSTSYNHAGADLSVSLMVADNFWVLYHGGQYYRTPGFLHEFGDRHHLIGAPDLNLESSLGHQFGVLYHPGPFAMVDDLRMEAVVFQTETRDRLGWEDAGGGLLEAGNLGGSRVTGIELSAQINLQDYLIIDAAYSYQEPLYASGEHEGNQLAAAARNTGHLSALVRQSYGGLYYDLYYQDSRFLDPANEFEAGPRLVHNLGVLYYRGRWSVGVEAANIANDRGPEALGQPTPGTRYVLFMQFKG